MSDFTLFTQTIRENPDDDLPRLALAKHLEDRGDPRGELIRVQLLLARLAEEDPERHELERREKKLVGTEGVAWLKELPRPTRGRFGFASWEATMERGRLSVAMDAEVFLGSAQALAGADDWESIEILHLREVSPDHMARIAASPLLAGVLSLTIGEPCANHTPIGDTVAEAVASCPFLANLRELALPNNFIGPAGAEALSCSQHLRRLRALKLEHNVIGPYGALALGLSECLPELRQLELYGNSIGNEGVRAIVTSPVRAGLTHLGLGDNQISMLGVVSLAGTRSVQGLQHLSLRDNRITQEDCHALAGSENFRHLRELNLGMGMTRSGISSKGALALARSPYMRNLRMLEMGGNPIGDRGVAALVASPVLAGVEELYLWECDIGDIGAAALAVSPHLADLKRLQLNENDIGSAGVRLLLDSPYLRKVGELELEGNPIGPRAQRALERRA